MERINQEAIKVLHHAVIYGHPDADTIVLERDRIRMIGRLSEWESQEPESEGVIRIDLHGQAVLPGFVDAHIHLIHTGLIESGWRVGIANLSRADTLGALAQAASERGGEWVIAAGWDESQWKDHRYLSREELDGISPNAPLVAVRMDGHLLVANSLAMTLIPETVAGHLIEREAGILREQAVQATLAIIRPDATSVADAVDAAARLCHRLGITSVHTMSPLDALPALMSHRDQRRLRVTLCPDVESLHTLLGIGLQTGFGDAWLRFGGIKMFADGSIGAGNAALSQPYVRGGLGELNYPDEELLRYVQISDRAGWQTAIHAIGDRAIEQILRTHEALETDPSLQHRIEHFELPQRSQIERTKAAGLHVCMQPNFIANWSGPGSMYVDRLGALRDEASNPLRWVIDEGIPLAFGSDGMPPSPLFGIHGAMHGAYSSQRVTIEEAISCYTVAGARLGFDEGNTGQLREGAGADLVVLAEDPRLNPAHVADCSVCMTWVGGDLVYAAPLGVCREAEANRGDD